MLEIGGMKSISDKPRARRPARWRRPGWWGLAAAVVLAGSSLAAPAVSANATLNPCRLKGLEHEARCGVVQRPLDPAQPQGPQIDVHFAVLPALARHKKPDPVFFFAGGPGQSAIALAGTLARPLARLTNRRDVVLIDQRGTGRSAPLHCPEQPLTQSLREMADPAAQALRLRECRAALQKLPHGDLRQYTTTVAMADAEAVRQALGAPLVNLLGGSYGTRAALEYLRQFPQAVRRVVIDGVAPPDMVLPASFSTDAQAALDALFAACQAEPGCAKDHPQLRERWAALLKSLPREVSAFHPLTGREERLTMTRELLTSLVRPPLYAPLLTSALPLAIDEASQGRFGALVGLTSALGSARGSAQRLAEGMHFSVICAEDFPRLQAGAYADRPGPDFANDFADMYRRVCDGWPQGTVPPAFYQVPPAPMPVLVLSGGLDPVTPPRHGQRVAQALGPQARHVVVPNAGHGLMLQGCLRDVVFRFIDAPDSAAALQVDGGCAENMPRPPAFVAPGSVPVQAPGTAVAPGRGGRS
ncbi:MAG: alpha/beta hydrolase [Rubrivivax sp.]|nr:alpha/beta hydrolase [Rubrivivax sp.]